MTVRRPHVRPPPHVGAADCRWCPLPRGHESRRGLRGALRRSHRSVRAAELLPRRAHGSDHVSAFPSRREPRPVAPASRPCPPLVEEVVRTRAAEPCPTPLFASVRTTARSLRLRPRPAHREQPNCSPPRSVQLAPMPGSGPRSPMGLCLLRPSSHGAWPTRRPFQCADATPALSGNLTAAQRVARDALAEWMELDSLPEMFDHHPHRRELLGPRRTLHSLHIHATDTPPKAAADWPVDPTGDTLAWQRAQEPAVSVHAPSRTCCSSFTAESPSTATPSRSWVMWSCWNSCRLGRCSAERPHLCAAAVADGGGR